MQEQLIERATLLFEQKRYNEAHKILLEVLAIQPDNVQTIIMLVDIKIQNEELSDAMQMTNNAISLDPDFDVLFYLKARIFLLQEKLDDAIESLKQAIEIDPYEANNFALLGHVFIQKKRFTEALDFANKALEIDSSHVFALNVRSTSLLKLNLKEDSFQTIQEALNEDPNNSYTHANFGWGLLEKGQTDDALKHFSESLKNDPNSEYAQSGMAEALKSKYLIYRWFLKYSFWMNNLTSKNQWVFIIGFYIVSKFLRGLAETNEVLKPFLTPLIILLAIFAFSTWIISPLSNLLFRLNKYGKHLLTIEEKRSSTLVGFSLLLMIVGLITQVFTKNEIGLALTVFGFTMMLPLGRFFENPTKLFKTYNIILISLGILSMIQIIKNGDLFNMFSILYIFGFIAFQWVSNYFSLKEK